jgi:hypothetical protein
MSKRKHRSQQGGVRQANGAGAANRSSQSKQQLPVNQAKQLAGRAQETLSSAARSASDRMEGLTQDAERAFKSYPLGVGAVAMAIGFALGLAIPSTVKEGRWLSQSRDQVLGKARALMRDVSETVGMRREQAAHS